MNVHERAERHHVAGGIAGFEFTDVLSAKTKIGVGLRGDLVGATKAVKVIHVERAKVGLQCVVHVAQGDVHALGFHAVHIHEELRHARGEGGEHLRQARSLAAVHHHPERRAGERIQTNVCAILNHHFESGGAAQATHGRRRQNQDARVAELGVSRVELTHDRFGGLARVFPTFKSFQRNEHRAGIGKIGADQQVVAGKLHRAVHTGNGTRDFAGAVDDLLAALQARAVGQLRKDDEVAGILGGDEAGRDGFETTPGQQQQPRINRQRDATAPDHPAHRARVAMRCALKSFVEKMEEPTEHPVHAGSEPIFFSVMALEEDRAERGRKGQRVECADHR